MVKAFGAHFVKKQMSTKVIGKHCAPRGDDARPPQHAPAQPVLTSCSLHPAPCFAEMQSDGRMKIEIFLQILQKYNDSSNNPQGRRWQHPFLQLAKAGPWKSSARVTGALPAAPERAAARHYASYSMLWSATSKIQFINRMFSPLQVQKLIPVPIASSEIHSWIYPVVMAE